MPNLNITNIPAPRVPFVDERTGLMAREWYRFFLNLFVLTGSGNNPITLEELQIGPPNQPDLAELLIQINQNIAPQYEDQSGDFLATLDTAQLMSMMARFENAEAAIQGAYLQPVVQTGTIANYNLDGSPTAGGIAYGTGPALAVSAAGTLGQVLTSAGAGTPTWTTPTTGTVTAVSVVSANGLAGTVATATTTPAITLSTTITGLLKGNGTAISAATSGTDYAPATSGTSILYGNGSGGFNNVTIGTGVAFAAGTLSATGSGGTVTSVTGTAPVVSSGGTTPAISMAAATTSVNGYLTSTDWTTFNNKGSGTVTSVAALTLGTTGTDLSSTVANATTTPVITLQVPTASASNRGALSAADWTTFNNKGSGTVTSVTGTAPVVSSGGTTPAISMAAATTSVNGYLTSTDWNTFNGKGSGSVTSVAQSFTGGLISVAGSPITTSGTLALTVAGTSGGVPYFTSGTTWATSAALTASALVVGGGAGAAPATITTGTGVTTALGVNTGTAGAFVVNGGALGTPSSGTVTNLTGTASININGTVGATTATTGKFTTIEGTDTTDATSTTAAAVKTAGGLAVVKKIYVGDNVVIATSGKGIDFSATPGTGTSELLADYEEGTWTPVITAGVGSFTSYTSLGVYTKVGRIVTAYCSFLITAVGTGNTFCNIAGYPFTSYNSAAPSDQASIALYRENYITGATGFTSIAKNATSGALFATFGNNYLFEFTMVYQAA
jgi:hypothetical protein